MSGPSHPDEQPSRPTGTEDHVRAERSADSTSGHCSHTDGAAAQKTGPQPMTGAQSLVRSLEEVGVEIIFGIPGGAILPALRPAVRHARSATCWSGTSRAPATPPPATRRPPAGSACAWRPAARARPTSSPRSPTPTWTASRSSPSPARCRAGAIGTDAFQEADISGITMPITKHNFLVQKAEDIPRTIAEAFHIASTGRPGPVLVDVPKDVLQADTTFSWPPQLDLPGYRSPTCVRSAKAGARGGRASSAREPQAGALRRRRRAQGRTPPRSCAELAELTEHPGRHHADGPRRLPRQPPAAPRHAGHARHGRGGHGAAEVRPADHARRPLRRPGDRQAAAPSPPRPR